MLWNIKGFFIKFAKHLGKADWEKEGKISFEKWKRAKNAQKSFLSSCLPNDKYKMVVYKRKKKQTQAF